MTDLATELNQLRQRRAELEELYELRQRVATLEFQTFQAKDQTNARAVLEMVCAEFGLNPALLFARNRKQAVVDCRHVTWYLLRHVLELPYATIGQWFDRHHGAVIHGVQNITDQCELNAKFRDRVTGLVERARQQESA